MSENPNPHEKTSFTRYGITIKIGDEVEVGYFKNSPHAILEAMNRYWAMVYYPEKDKRKLEALMHISPVFPEHKRYVIEEDKVSGKTVISYTKKYSEFLDKCYE